MAQLTKTEEKWLTRVQRALDACPSPTIGFYTIGDYDVKVYRKPRGGDLEDNDLRSDKDFCTIVDDADAELGALDFPGQVHSTAG